MYQPQPYYNGQPGQEGQQHPGAGYAPPQYNHEVEASAPLAPAVYGIPENADQTATQQFPNPMGKFADIGVLRDVWFALLWIITVIVVISIGLHNIATDNIYYEADGSIYVEFSAETSCSPATNLVRFTEMDECRRQIVNGVTYYTMASCDNDNNVFVGALFLYIHECEAEYGSFKDLKHSDKTYKFSDEGACVCIPNQLNDCARLVMSTCKRESGSLGSDIPKFVAAGFIVSIGVSIVILITLRKFPKEAIIVANIVVAGLFLGLAALFLSIAPIVSLFYVLFAVLILLLLYCARDRIPFAAACLKCSSTVVLTYWGVIVNAFIWIIAQVFFGVIWFYSIGSDEAYIALSTGVFILFVLLFYWGMEVFKNINHVTMCGVTADWFFSLGGPGTPPHYGGGGSSSSPTPSACLRAAVWSLGSICFGSLLVAIISTIRFIAQNADTRNAFVQCIVVCILRCLEDLLRYFNDYAYVQVAMFGKSYLTAAIDTFAIIKQGGGWDAIINDCLIDRVYLMFSLLGGLLVGFIVFFMAELNWAWFVIGLIEGFIIISIFMRLLYSGVLTVFVGFWHLRSSGNVWNPPPLGGAPVDQLNTKLSNGYNGNAV